LRKGENILKGDLIALLAAVFFAFYAINSGNMIKNTKCPISLYLTITAIMGIIISYLMSRILEENIVIFSTDEDNGIFGFLSSLYFDEFITKNSKNIIYGAIGIGILAGSFLFCLSWGAKDNISPFCVDVTFNFAPFLSQCVGYFMKLQGFPGGFTAYGGAFLFVGCTMLAMNYKDQKEIAELPLIGHVEPMGEVEEETQGSPNKFNILPDDVQSPTKTEQLDKSNPSSGFPTPVQQ